MLYSDFISTETTDDLSFIEELVALGRRNDHKRVSDYEQLVPSQGNLSDALQDWWNTQESPFLDSPIMCTENANMDSKKLPPSYDEHVSAASSSVMHMRTVPSGHDFCPYTRAISPSGSDVSVLQSESDLSTTDETEDQSSRLLNDIMECIQTVDSQDRNERKSPDVQTGNISTYARSRGLVNVCKV